MIKRFIAGATCPDCGATDSIRVWQEDAIWQRECVHCGHYGRLDAQAAPTAAAQNAAEKSAEALKFVPLKVLNG